MAVGLLICTLISENQGLKKSRSVSNLRKFLGPANLDIFFLVCHLDFFSDLQYKTSFFSRWRPRKNSRFAGPEIFLRFEKDLDFHKSFCRLKGRITMRVQKVVTPLCKRRTPTKRKSRLDFLQSQLSQYFRITIFQRCFVGDFVFEKC